MNLNKQNIYLSFLEADDKLIAEQLTLMDFEIFKRISVYLNIFIIFFYNN